ncbi:MAG TPA: pyridoxal-phosphate dependent enzyme [Acidimicrobiales bacterium]|nr:pyridoxal-phosphate dependent enzyme [Acidimicrobiales bacterium]
MRDLGREDDIVDQAVYERTVERFRERRILLPTFAELATPSLIPVPVRRALAAVGPDDADPLNLFRVHWYNAVDRSAQVPVPGHVVLPRELTGVEARIVVLFGDRFPMIHAHKVLAAYGCLVPRVVTGRFDPTAQRAVWPSTGNYCRGGVAISRLMSCRGVAVLPEGMSRERFSWLGDWVADPSDVIVTPGTESNVKEIYDKCAELARDPGNVIFNQFSEFGNHLVHYACTGTALADVFAKLAEADPALVLRAFVSASGSAGTLGAGDYLKESFGARIVAVEALECPTMLYNGFGEHNIQGIGDKHIPYIHNVYNTDIVTAVSDQATDHLAVLFGTPAGKAFLADRRGVPPETLAILDDFGLSSICNIVAAIKTAKYLGLGSKDVVMTVATDGAELYESERARVRARDFSTGFDDDCAAGAFGQFVLGVGSDHLLDTTAADRARIFNLGYYTWVEQQGVAIDEFNARRDQSFWRGLRAGLPRWDELIREFNARTGVTVT